MCSPVSEPVEQVTAEDAAAHAERLLAADAATRTLGIVLSDVCPGRATATLTVTAAMVQGHGTCHGGYLFLLADTAFAFASNSRGVPTVAAGADIEFLLPAGEGDVLVAAAAERVLRGRGGIYDVTVRRGSDVVCEFRGRSRALRAAAG